MSGGLNAVGSTSWKDSKLEPPALLEPAAAAKVKNVAGATLIGTGSKQKRTSPSPPPTFKLPVASLMTKPDKEPAGKRKLPFAEAQPQHQKVEWGREKNWS